MASAPEIEAEAYLRFETVRWPAGPSSCPHCGATGRCRLLIPTDGRSRRTRTGRLTARRVWRCGQCRRQFSVLTGTVFERTRVPLSVWLAALSILAEPSDQRSVSDIAQASGVSVDTARVMLHLVRTGLSAGGAAPQLQG